MWRLIKSGTLEEPATEHLCLGDATNACSVVHVDPLQTCRYICARVASGLPSGGFVALPPARWWGQMDGSSGVA